MRASEEADVHRFEYTQVHMGVQARIVLYAPDSSAARRAAGAAFDRIAYLDGVMSDYRPDSELMRLCARAGSGAIPVSEDLFHVLSVAQELARRSGGAFDVTVGPFVRLWRRARQTGQLPHPDSLARTRSRVGWHLVSLDSMRQTVALETPGMQLDLGGIAKGFAADEAVAAMRAEGIRRTMVEFGGDVVAGDPPPKSTAWHVTAALLDPREDAVAILNEAVSTSADTEQFVEIDGVRYSHVVDPRTGLGLTDRTAAVVIAPRGILSDALATALASLGAEAGRTLIDRWYSNVRVHILSLD